MARRKMLVADLLCGAGGSSTGCKRALDDLGLEMDLVAVNHWPTAIDTHQRNHPEARHYVQDIATVRPHLLVPEGYLDLLMASPTCTHHSVARGGKPTSDQQRSDPWHIITWLTELRVKRIIIENVWEFIGWGPVDTRTGKPIKSRKGEYFQAWIDTLRRVGFTELEWRKLNAANYGDATTRQRFILKGRSDHVSIGWAPLTHTKRSDNVELFPTVKPWRPAREIIDWSIRGRSIFGRKRPLAPKTLARILAGAIKFGWPAVFIKLLYGEIDNSLRYMIRWAFARRNVRKKGTNPAKRRALVRDTVARLRHFRSEPEAFAKGGRSAMPMVVTLRRNGAGSSIDGPIPALAAHGNHVGVAEPVIGNLKNRTVISSPDEPLPTQTEHSSLFTAEPIVLSQHNTGAPRSVDEPLPALTTGGAAAEEHPGCARPILVTVAHGNSPNDATADERRANSVEDPIGAVHGGGNKFGVAEAFVLSQASGGAPRDVGEPLPTSTTGGKGAAHALIAPYYGSGSGESSSSAEDPLPTVTSKGRFGMVVPVTQNGGGAGARNLDTDPLPTMTTAKGGEFAMVVPVTHDGIDDRALDPNTTPLPTVTGANRGELAFITAQHGERAGQSPRVHDIAAPLPTIAATGHVDLVQRDDRYDILFRMLEPHELAAAMGFNGEDGDYEFAGTKTEQVKQIGNAVSVALMKAEVRAFMQDVVPLRRLSPEEVKDAMGLEEDAA